ncbi:PAS domain-containing protein [Maricaulis sp.]|uniref:PAS domain-containing sensor histidine kinase n=1 Tax=Maricaulis sp. TaxID=1486257 RepID=UPI0026276108|nr:PAS domain-containing protein [Maricaulis sp.]MDF1768030.1 PAS domain-containing protein [Maricaulis sp.]
MTTRSAEMQRALFACSPLAILVLNAHGAITSINSSAAELLGYDQADLAGKRAQIVFADARAYDQLEEAGFNIPDGLPEGRFTTRYRTRNSRVFDGETVAARAPEPKTHSTGAPGSEMPGTGVILFIRDVTAELSLKAKLEASDIQLRAALASANEGAFSLNLVTRLGSTRGFINEFLGISSADATISLERWLEITDTDHRQHLADSIETLRSNPTQPLDVTFRARRADDAWRWLHMRGKVTEFTREGHALRVSGVVSDSTDRQALEDKLAARERQLADAIESGSSGVWEIDLASRQVTPIVPIRAILGLPPEPQEVDRSVWLARVHDSDKSVLSSLVDALADGTSDTLDIEHRVLDARTDKWVWLRSRGRIKPQGDTRVAAGVLIDITERKQLEIKLIETERLMREGLEGANDGAWSLDIKQDQLHVSGVLARLLDVEDGSVVSSDDWYGLIPEEGRARARKRFDEFLHQPRERPGSGSSQSLGRFRVISPDSSEVWLRSRGRVVEWADDGSAERAAGIVSNITEERRLERALAESDRRLREALLAAGEGAWRIDLKTRVGEVSAIVAEMMGLPPGDARVTYDDWLSRVHPDDMELTRDSFQQLESGERDSVDLILRYQSEKSGWIRIHNRGRISERDSHGVPTVASGFIADISERLATQEALADREQQLFQAVTAAALGTWRIDMARQTIDLRGTIVAELFGEKDARTIGLDEWRERIHPADIAGVDAVVAHIMTTPNVQADDQYRLRDWKGDFVWHRLTGRIIERDERGRPVAASGVLWNVDATRQLEAMMSEERARFERIYRATPAMMHTIDADGHIVEVSDYWLSHLGYKRSEVIGRKSTDFLDAESQERAIDVELPRLFQVGHNTHTPYRYVRKNGDPVDVLLSSFLERDTDGNPSRSYAILTDVTELRATNIQLERTNRELDRFATVASHDLQEPLRKVAAFSSLVKRRYSDKLDEDGVRSLDFLADAAQRMQRLITELLDYSKLSSQPLNLEEVDTRALVTDVLDQIETRITENNAVIQIQTLPTLQSDPVLLTQIFQNLISNAVKYRGIADSEVMISSEATATGWTFTVADNGIGMDMRFAEKIFAPFQRLHTREEYEGTGIGLAVVRQAVERLGGTIRVESEQDEGTRFTFDLPRTPPRRSVPDT